MSVKTAQRLLVAATVSLVAGLCAPAWAQLSSPLGAAPVAGAAGIPSGTGPGVHSPNSPIAPLPVRADVLPWSLLTAVKTQVVGNRIVPTFGPEIRSLSQRKQRLQGFMMPLDPGEKQRHFLLSSVPLTCSFCVAGGPESMVEVYSKQAVRYTLEPVVVEGQFVVLNDDKYGLYYRMTEAVGVK